MADKIDTAKLLAGTDLVSLVGTHISLAKSGAEFVGKCPFHEDKTPSLKVNPAKQMWHCFGCGAGSDALDFLQKLFGISFRDAAEMLGSSTFNASVPAIEFGLKKLAPRRTFAAPDGEYPDLKIRRLGEPIAHWEYRDTSGALLGVVARYEAENGKEIRCFSWGNRADHEPPAWECAHFGKPRPLYGLDRLTAMPTARVIVVEGEKTADAAAALFPRNPVVTWPGGANAVQNADWRLLDGRECILVPDNDQAGHQAMSRVAAYLHEYGAAKVLGINPDTQPDGTETPPAWDLADANWTPSDAAAWAKSRMMEYPRVAKPVLTAVEPPELTISVPEIPEGHPAAETPTGPDSEPVSENVVPLNPPVSAPAPELLVVDGNALRKPIRREIEAEAMIQSAEYSEFSMADGWVDRCGHDWRYVPQDKAWKRWNGVFWVEDEVAGVMWSVKEDVAEQSVSAIGKETTAARRRLESRKTQKNVAEIVAAHPRIATARAQWDADIWSICTPAGMVDLKTGAIRPTTRDDLVSKCTSVAPIAGPHPLWDKVLDNVSGGDPETACYLQRWAGYWLTGDCSEEAFMFVFGPEGSGKGSFMTPIQRILGKGYAVTAKTESLMHSERRTGNESAWADYAGARLLIANETNEGQRWDEAAIKQVVGRDTVRARQVYGKGFEYEVTYKIVISGNAKPIMRTAEQGMRRRLHMVEFSRSVAQRDTTLKDRIIAEELPAIFHWMLEGCKMWQREGLGKPDGISASSETYIKEQDVLGSWIDELCEVSPEYHCATDALYRSFSEWCAQSHEYNPGKNRFSAKMELRGFARRKVSQVRSIVGLRLKLPDMPDYGEQ